MDERPGLSEFVDAWPLFGDAVLCAVIAGAVLGFLSVYVSLRRMVFVTAAVTQAAGFGVALAFFAGIHFGWHVDPGVGAVAVSLLVSTVFIANPERVGITREMILGIAYALCAGAAVALGSKISQEANDIQAILFGSAVMVDPADLKLVTVVAALVLAAHVCCFRGLTFASFDPLAARVQGVPVRFLDALLLLSIGVATGVATRALGAMPVFALSTLPAIAILPLARGPLWVPFVGAAVLGAAIGAVGYFLAFRYDLPVGASQTLSAVAATIPVLAYRAVRAKTGTERRA